MVTDVDTGDMHTSGTTCSDVAVVIKMLVTLLLGGLCLPHVQHTLEHRFITHTKTGILCMRVPANLPHDPGRYTTVSAGDKHYLPGARWDKSRLHAAVPPQTSPACSRGRGALGIVFYSLAAVWLERLKATIAVEI